MPIAPIVYVMKGVLNSPPYQDVTWRVYGSADLTGAQSGYFGQLINIKVDYTITDELAGQNASPIQLEVIMGGDVSGQSSACTVTDIQNRAIAATAPADGQDLTWVAANSDWEPKFSSQLRTQTFTSGGSWTAPSGVTQVKVFACGGGGGGEAGNSADYIIGGSISGLGGGGGGGAYASTVILTVTPGNTYTITIGAGGTGGVIGGVPGGVGQPGTNGGDTTFGSLYTWKGATGGGIAGKGVGGTSLPFSKNTFYVDGEGDVGQAGNGGTPSGYTTNNSNGQPGGGGYMHIGNYYSSPNGGGAVGAAGRQTTAPFVTYLPGGCGGGGGGASNSGLGTPGAGGAGGDSSTIGNDGHPLPGNPGGNATQGGHGGGGGGGGAAGQNPQLSAGGAGGNGSAGFMIINW